MTAMTEPTVPTVDDLLMPVLAVHPSSGQIRRSEVHDRVAAALHLSAEACKVPSRTHPSLFENRVDWAITRLAEANMLVRGAPREGTTSLTREGRELPLPDVRRSSAKVPAKSRFALICPMIPRRGPAPRDRVGLDREPDPTTGIFGYLVLLCRSPGPG